MYSTVLAGVTIHIAIFSPPFFTFHPFHCAVNGSIHIRKIVLLLDYKIVFIKSFETANGKSV
jgi:hypothetical protein